MHEKSGYAPELITAPAIWGEQFKYSFTLKPARTLQIRVVDQRGNPIPDQILYPEMWRKTPVLRIYGFRGNKWNGPQTDADGIYVWKDAPEDPVTWVSGDIKPVKQYLQKAFTLTASDQLQTVIFRDAIKVAIGAAVDADTNVRAAGIQGGLRARI